MIKERENWVDWAKALGILLVVMGHSSYAPWPIRGWIFLFHMPLFFFISGYLTSPKAVSYRDLAVKSWHQLLVPYVLFNLIASIRFLFPLINDWSMGADPQLPARLFGQVRALVLGLPDGQYCIPSWFLLALLWCRFLHKFIHSQRLYYALLTAVLLVGLFTLHITLYSLDCALLGFVWFEFGYFVKQNKHRVTLPKALWFLLAVVGFLAVYMVNEINGTCDYRLCKFGGVIGLIGSAAGIVALCSVCKLLQGVQWRFILIASQATLVIMCLHMLLQYYVGYFMPSHLDEGLRTFTFDVTITLLLTLSYPLISRHLPALTGHPQRVLGSQSTMRIKKTETI